MSSRRQGGESATCRRGLIPTLASRRRSWIAQGDVHVHSAAGQFVLERVGGIGERVMSHLGLRGNGDLEIVADQGHHGPNVTEFGGVHRHHHRVSPIPVAEQTRDGSRQPLDVEQIRHLIAGGKSGWSARVTTLGDEAEHRRGGWTRRDPHSSSVRRASRANRSPLQPTLMLSGWTTDWPALPARTAVNRRRRVGGLRRWLAERISTTERSPGNEVETVALAASPIAGVCGPGGSLPTRTRRPPSFWCRHRRTVVSMTARPRRWCRRTGSMMTVTTRRGRHWLVETPGERSRRAMRLTARSPRRSLVETPGERSRRATRSTVGSVRRWRRRTGSMATATAREEPHWLVMATMERPLPAWRLMRTASTGKTRLGSARNP